MFSCGKKWNEFYLQYRKGKMKSSCLEHPGVNGQNEMPGGWESRLCLNPHKHISTPLRHFMNIAGVSLHIQVSQQKNFIIFFCSHSGMTRNSNNYLPDNLKISNLNFHGNKHLELLCQSCLLLNNLSFLRCFKKKLN
jgi:hypothetical protein